MWELLYARTYMMRRPFEWRRVLCVLGGSESRERREWTRLGREIDGRGESDDQSRAVTIAKRTQFKKNKFQKNITSAAYANSNPVTWTWTQSSNYTRDVAIILLYAFILFESANFERTFVHSLVCELDLDFCLCSIVCM